PSEQDAAEWSKWGLPERRIGLVHDLELRRQYRPGDLPEVVDLGDVPYEAGESLERYGARLRFVTERVLGSGMRPFSIAVDHSTSPFPSGAVSRHLPRYGILHSAAHHDLYKGLPPRPLSHANPFAYLVGEPSLVAIRQIGLRAGFEHVDASLSPVREP